MESAEVVSADDRARAIATLVSAFTSDPAIRWLYPEAHQYLTHFPDFVTAFGGRAFEHDTAWNLDVFSAVALWLPPDTAPDGDEVAAVLTASVEPAKHADLFGVLEQMGEAHPTYAHWYLPWFGVDAALQGKGLGGQLMAQCLATVDGDHLPAYLENTNRRNVPFYERHGFVVTGEAQAGESPPIILMARAAR